jgi:UDP:flavonoid glycosyltransferase YjiC (YdhE family)
MIVHQGGIGTTAEALRSGRPMLVVPFSHDQFDNAERCGRIGVGGWISRADYNERRALREIQRMLDNKRMPERCSRIGSAVAAEHGVMNAATAVEKITTH